MTCPTCGNELSEAARFCSSCGTPQGKADEERRVVTVLFADLVGFTALAEQLDPEEVKHRVDACFERLTADIMSFGGVVDKVLGDGIVALFGAPVAHEDDAERAVRAGLRLQQTLATMATELEAPFRMRVGINTGEVLVGSSSAGRDYTAMGDVVNSADRLQSLAAPGQVLVGPATHDATTEAISYQDLGELDVRGRQESLRAWSALSAVRPPGARTRRIADFVGRERELDLLHAQARMAVELEQAQIATVFGEAGTGKTRLVEEAAGQMASRFGARVLEGRCVPYGEANVWWPIADVLRHAFGLATDCPQDEAEVIVKTGLEVHLPEDSEQQRERIHLALTHALGFNTPMRGGDRNRNRSEVTFAMSRILEVELEQRPVVMVLSDVHWAAEAVWQLVGHLLDELGRSRLILLVTARRSEIAEAIQGRFGSLTLELGPLDGASSRQLVEELGLDLPDDEAAELIERSGGNPFFLEELVGLVGSGAADVALGESRTGRLDQIPDNLRGILASRLDRLDPPARNVLELASVLGRSGSVEGLITMNKEAGLSDDILPELHTLEQADLLSISGSRFEFVSDLVREVAYGTITKTARARLHAGIAGYLEHISGGAVRNSMAVAVAHHYASAAQLLTDLTETAGVDAPTVTSNALHWLGEAGNRAMEAGAPTEATRWFTQGLELSGDDGTRAQFLYGRAKARCEVRDIAGTKRDLERLEALSLHDPVLQAQSLVVAGDLEQKAGDPNRAAGLLREAADRLETLDQPADRSLALRLLGVTEMFRGDEPLALQALNASREVAAAADERREEAWATQSLAMLAFRTGRVGEATELVNEAERMFTELDDRNGLTWTHGVAAWVAFHMGDWETAKALVAEILPETKRRGDPWAEAVMLILDASMSLWSGEAERALAVAVSTQKVAERSGEVALLVQAQAVEGRALISRGRVAEGVKVLEQTHQLALRAGDDDGQRLAVISNCAAAARLGNSEGAIRWAARFDGPHDDPSVVGESDLTVSLALAFLQRGSVAEATSQISWIDSFEKAPPNMYAEAVGAMVAAASHAPDVAERKAATVLAGPATYMDQTLAHLSCAAVANAAGRSTEVDEHLAEARRALENTDDLITPTIVDLLAAVCGRAPIDEAEDAMRQLGLDPAGWRMAWSMASAPGSVAV